MFPRSYFGARYFAPTYFPGGVGGEIVFVYGPICIVNKSIYVPGAINKAVYIPGLSDSAEECH